MRGCVRCACSATADCVGTEVLPRSAGVGVGSAVRVDAHATWAQSARRKDRLQPIYLLHMLYIHARLPHAHLTLSYQQPHTLPSHSLRLVPDAIPGWLECRRRVQSRRVTHLYLPMLMLVSPHMHAATPPFAISAATAAHNLS